MKTCTHCKKEKGIEMFFKDKQKKSGYSPVCKECKTQNNKKWAKNNPEKVTLVKDKWLSNNKEYRQIISLRSHLKRKYGLTIEQYEFLVEKQNGVCAICKKEDTIGRLSVDHCHKTGKIRGLLCRNCNSMLGLAKESSILLRAGIDYLKSFDDVHACTLADKNLIVKMK